MAATTQQVQRAQAAAKKAGFARGEFTAQTERVYCGTRNGRRMYEYGDLFFVIHTPINGNEATTTKAMNLIHSGYDVSILRYNGRSAHISASETRMPSGIGMVTVDTVPTVEEESAGVVRTLVRVI